MYKIKVNTPQEVNQQEQDFQALLSRLGKISLAEAKAILESREVVKPEPGLSPDIIARFKERINNKMFLEFCVTAFFSLHSLETPID